MYGIGSLWDPSAPALCWEWLYEAPAFTSCIQQELMVISEPMLLVKNTVEVSASFRGMSQPVVCP